MAPPLEDAAHLRGRGLRRNTAAGHPRGRRGHEGGAVGCGSPPRARTRTRPRSRPRCAWPQPTRTSSSPCAWATRPRWNGRPTAARWTGSSATCARCVGPWTSPSPWPTISTSGTSPRARPWPSRWTSSPLHAHPMWNGQPLDNAVNWLKEQYMACRAYHSSRRCWWARRAGPPAWPSMASRPGSSRAPSARRNRPCSGGRCAAGPPPRTWWCSSSRPSTRTGRAGMIRWRWRSTGGCFGQDRSAKKVFERVLSPVGD